jgi:putative N6-adenine-specific DNA methylase
MPDFNARAPITITCNNRLSPFLAMELEALGYQNLEPFATGVRLEGSLNDCIRLNLSLRCASQVLYHLKSFLAPNPDVLYEQLKDFRWEDLFQADGYFSVNSNVRNEHINNNLFANLRVKDAIVDRFRELLGAVINLYWNEDQAELFLDTSGNSIARHGYRKLPGRAPMLEALAAATIISTRWDRKSPFINPMCGSGTLAIEAALLASNTAPGLFRTHFAFMALNGYDDDFYLNERGKMEDAIEENVKGLRIIASDYSEQAIDTAKRNARAAGVASMIEFKLCDFRKTDVPAGEAGVMMINPEYGERLGEVSHLEGIYAEIGNFMKHECAGYWGYVFTGNLELAKHIGLKPKRKIPFFNSKLDARLLEFELYSGSKRAAQQ